MDSEPKADHKTGDWAADPRISAGLLKFSRTRRPSRELPKESLKAAVSAANAARATEPGGAASLQAVSRLASSIAPASPTVEETTAAAAAQRRLKWLAQRRSVRESEAKPAQAQIKAMAASLAHVRTALDGAGAEILDGWAGAAEVKAALAAAEKAVGDHRRRLAAADAAEAGGKSGEGNSTARARPRRASCQGPSALGALVGAASSAAAASPRGSWGSARALGDVAMALFSMGNGLEQLTLAYGAESVLIMEDEKWEVAKDRTLLSAAEEQLLQAERQLRKRPKDSHTMMKQAGGKSPAKKKAEESCAVPSW